MVWVQPGQPQCLHKDGQHAWFWRVVFIADNTEPRWLAITLTSSFQHTIPFWVQAGRGPSKLAWSVPRIVWEDGPSNVPRPHPPSRPSRRVCVEISETSGRVELSGREHASCAHGGHGYIQDQSKYFDVDAYKNGTWVQDISRFEHALQCKARSSFAGTRGCVPSTRPCDVCQWWQIVF